MKKKGFFYGVSVAATLCAAAATAVGIKRRLEKKNENGEIELPVLNNKGEEKKEEKSFPEKVLNKIEETLSVNGALTLKAKNGVKVTLYKGLNDEETPVSPKKTLPLGDYFFCYYNLPESENGYHFIAEMEGFCTLNKRINRPEKEEKIIEINLKKLEGTGFEPKTVIEDTDELIEKLLEEKEEWKEKFEDVFKTPLLHNFDISKNGFTSNSELEEFINSATQNCGFAYKFNLLNTEKNHFCVPAIIFTRSNIKDCETYKTAATVMERSGRPTVLYQAQIHGNEPAASETALAVIKSLSGKYGEKIIKALNIIVIPRLNPEGSMEFIRKNKTGGIDMNRDNMKTVSGEVAAVHELFNTFLPFAVLDGHEYKSVLKEKGPYKDVLLGVGGGFNTTRELSSFGAKATNSVIENLNKEGIIATYYHASKNAGAIESGYAVNTANFSTCRGYYSLKGAISLLIETRGIGIGKQGFVRRVVSQYITVTSLLDYLFDHATELKNTVMFERQKIINEGKIFKEDNIFALYSGSDFKTFEETLNPEYNLLSGEFTEKERKTKNYYYNLAVRQRAKATAYVLSKECGEKVENLIKNHGISFYTLPAGTKIKLRQYKGEAEPKENTPYFIVKEAELSGEETVEFKTGAYVFPANQISGTLLRYLFEPDVTDTENYGSSLCQNGLLKPEDIYRYEHNSEPDGSIKKEDK